MGCLIHIVEANIVYVLSDLTLVLHLLTCLTVNELPAQFVTYHLMVLKTTIYRLLELI